MKNYTQNQIAQEIRRFARARGLGKTCCPSEVARELYPDNWRSQMDEVRDAAKALAEAGEVRVLQSGKEVEMDQAKGPVKIQIVQ